MKKKVVFIAVFCILAIVCMVLSPSRFILAASNGMLVFATAVLPALFPFIFFTKLLFSVEADKALSKVFAKPLQAMFGVRGEASFVFVVSLFSGYPVGSKSIYDLSERVALTKTEACRITSFCSNSGPMFLLGTVGAMFLKSSLAGTIVFISHILGSILNGLLYRKYKAKNGEELSKNAQHNKSDNSLQNIIFSSVSSALSIGGFITIFFIICEMLSFLGIENFLTSNIANLTSTNIQTWKSLLFGFFEVTRGCFEISTSALSLSAKTIICTLLASFGGLSIAAQSLSFLSKVNVPTSFYLYSKLSHALFSTLLALLLCQIFM